MRHFTGASRIILVLGFLLGISSIGLGQDLPMIKGKKTVAIVNGEPITLSEFNQERRGSRKRREEAGFTPAVD